MKKHRNVYKKYRKNNIDPILLTELPISNKFTIKDTFRFPFKWNPYNGNRSTKLDKNGPISFDPDTLINFFYNNRLSHLWTDGFTDIFNCVFEGHYDDAVGNGPDFLIPGRGEHWDWYLFRLPIIDCYVHEKCSAVTMGPKLTYAEIKQLDVLGKKYGDNYEKTYGYKRPKLTEIYKLYQKAINKNPKIKSSKKKTYAELKYKYNIDAVEKIKKL